MNVRRTALLSLAVVLGVILMASASFADPVGWNWPIPSSNTLTQGFSSGHNGVDIGAAIGDQIYAPTGGKIYHLYKGCTRYGGLSSGKNCKNAGVCSPNHGYNSASGTAYGYCNYGYGNGVCLLTNDGYYVQFAHMQSVNSSLYEGQNVSQGTLLGYVGGSGCATGKHCHYAVNSKGEFTSSGFIDPMSIPYGPVDPCSGYGCSESYAGWYRCTAPQELMVHSSHDYNSSSEIGSIPANAVVWVSKKATASGKTFAHITYGSLSGIASFNYLSKVNSYTLSFNDNGGSGGPGSVTVWDGVSSYSTVSIPSRSNYTFLGYYTSTSGGTQVYNANGVCTNEGSWWSGSTYAHNADGTLYAQWRINVIYITSVSLDQTNVELPTDGSLTLMATVLPSDATYPTLTWSSGDSNVVTVNGGRIQAVNPGTTNVTASSTDGSGCKATCRVFVYPRIDDLLLNRHSIRLGVEDPFNITKLTAMLTPDVSADVNWVTSDRDVAMVTSDGTVHAVGEGRATITASVYNGPSDSCVVTVAPELRTLALPQNLSAIETEAFAGINAEAVLLPRTVETIGKRAFADNPNLYFVFLPNSVNEVAADAFAGDRRLTLVAARSIDTSEAGVDIPVIYNEDAAYVPVVRFSIPASLSLTIDETSTLTPDFSPASASNKGLTWESDNPSVAAVDQNGIVTAVDIGSANITATTVDGGLTAACKVTVSLPNVRVAASMSSIESTDTDADINAIVEVSGIPSLGRLEMYGIEVFDGSGERIGRTVVPFNGTDPSNVVCWFNLNSDLNLWIAADTTYTLKYLAIVSGYTFYSDAETFTTKAPIPRLVLNTDNVELNVGESGLLIATLLNHEPEDIIWRTSNSGVVYVVDGEIRGISKGTATITARAAEDTSLYAVCTVTVN